MVMKVTLMNPFHGLLVTLADEEVIKPPLGIATVAVVLEKNKV